MGVGDQNHPQEKETIKSQNSCLRRPYKQLRKVKGKGEKERCTQLNAEFQRLARRDKKAFLSEQCKEIQNEWEKQDLFKKIKGTFHAKTGTSEHFMQRWVQ